MLDSKHNIIKTDFKSDFVHFTELEVFFSILPVLFPARNGDLPLYQNRPISFSP